MKYVFYHASCMDGFGAALSAWLVFRDAAKYIPSSYGREESIFDNDFQEEDEVYILDYSISNENFEKLCDLVGKVVILDHHKTALERFTDGLHTDGTYLLQRNGNYVLFDMEKSGALLSWEYFHPGIMAPNLIKFISDRDLGQFRFEVTKPVHAYLSSKKMKFEIWDEIMHDLADPKYAARIFNTGYTLLDLQDEIVTKICKHAQFVEILGHVVPTVNATSHWSEVGEKLGSMYPQAKFTVSYGDMADGTRLYSLRSKPGFDVSEVAKVWGGGGHATAAGFKVKMNNLHPEEFKGETYET